MMAKAPDIPSFTSNANLAKGDAPPAAPAGPQGPAAAPAVDMTPKAPPRNLFSGTMKKLEVYGKAGTDPNEPIPGYVLFWFDDIDGGIYIKQALASGYEYVQADEVAIANSDVFGGNSDTGSNVSVFLGVNADNSPRRTILMKKPKWLHELHMSGPDSLEQRVHRRQDEQLASGTFNVNPNDRPYTAVNPYPGTRSSLPPIQMGRYYKPPST